MPRPARRGNARLITRLIALVSTSGLAFLVLPGAAHASTLTPSQPTGVHVSAVSSSSFTAVSDRAAHTSTYRVFASVTKSAVYLANVASAAHSRPSSRPSATITGLVYRTSPYYYRLEAASGAERRFSDIYSVSLRPPTPTGLQAISNAAGTYLMWKSESIGFAIAQGTDPALDVGRRDYVIRGQGQQFTPYDLVTGTTYYFRVAAFNGTTKSGYSAEVRAAPITSEEGVRVMTYNILEGTSAGSIEGGQVIAPWLQRLDGVVTLIREADPDVIDIQEAAAWVDVVKGARQIDSLVSALAGTYALARTEVPPTEPHYSRHADYIMYKVATYTVVGKGDHWSLGYNNAAAYQILRNRRTGAKFLATSAHLTVGTGAVNDLRRQLQTVSLLSQAKAYAALHGNVPVIYGGDFNSDVNANHEFDGPGLAMHADLAADAQDCAQSLDNQIYNSANLYQRAPPAFGQSIDHIYAPAGVAVRSWALCLDLVDGQFVGIIPSDHNPLMSDLSFPY